MMSRVKLALLNALWLSAIPATAFAQGAERTTTIIQNSGVSGIWVLANLAYAGMRAQGSKDSGWVLLSFIFGLPGTLLTLFVVTDGSERAYGVDLPKRRA
jgi:hypothetical protein